MTPITWHRITSTEPADKARTWVRNGKIGRPARWDAGAREWWWKSDTEDWRASAMCYEEWRDWDGHAPEPEPVAEPVQIGLER